MPKFIVSGVQNERFTSVVIDAVGVPQAMAIAEKRGIVVSGVQPFGRPSTALTEPEPVPEVPPSIALQTLSLIPGVGGVALLLSGATGNPAGMVLGGLLFTGAYLICSSKNLKNAWKGYSRIAGIGGTLGILGLVGFAFIMMGFKGNIGAIGEFLGGLIAVPGYPGFVALGLDSEKFVKACVHTPMGIPMRVISTALLLYFAFKKI